MNKIICLGNVGVGGQRGNVFLPIGIMTCLTATQYKDPPKILVKRGSNERHNISDT